MEPQGLETTGAHLGVAVRAREVEGGPLVACARTRWVSWANWAAHMPGCLPWLPMSTARSSCAGAQGLCL
jgi:hypothetical protein